MYIDKIIEIILFDLTYSSYKHLMTFTHSKLAKLLSHSKVDELLPGSIIFLQVMNPSSMGALLLGHEKWHLVPAAKSALLHTNSPSSGVGVLLHRFGSMKMVLKCLW